MRLVVGFAIDFHRELLRALAGAEPADDRVRAEVARAKAAGRFDHVDVAALVERSLETLEHIDRNANQSALLECWLDDLSQLGQGPIAPAAHS